MLVKDIIILASEFIGNNELAEGLKDNSLSDDQTLLSESLVKCFNLINNEITSEYIPIIKRETIKTENFKIDFDKFSNKLLKIISVEDKFGNKLKYKVIDDYVFVFAKTVNITYSTVPQKYKLTDEFETNIPERVYAYGIAREFCFLQAMFDDGDLWEQRFKSSLETLSKRISSVYIPRRRWI